MHSKNIAAATISLLAGLQAASAHSWVETIRLIGADGTYKGEAGYPIGYVDRAAPGFNDVAVQNKILDTTTNPAVCKPLAGAYQTYKRLSAAAGDYVALQYQENGHVTDPTQTLRPFRGGNVYVYGTQEHQDGDGINDVLNAWTADGQGGNGKGRLLATHYYDDGVCYQNRGGAAGFPVYTERSAKYGEPEVACQTDFQLPADLPASGKYTVMWVWDWPRIIDDAQNVTEIYTSCAEIDLGAASGSKAEAVNFAAVNDKNVAKAAIPSQVKTLIEATALGVGTNSPAAVQKTAGPGDATDAPAQPTTTAAAASSSAPVSVTTTKAHKSKGGNNNAVETVTVTADPKTTTEIHTVTAGNANGGNKPTSQAATQPAPTGVTSVQPFIPSSSQAAATSSTQAAATSQAVVTSVQPFLQVRATGAARRRAAGLFQ